MIKKPFEGFILFVCTIFIILVPLGWFLSWAIDYNHKKTYTGVITKVGYESNDGYYKYSGNPKYYILLQVDSINASIRINVTVPLWSQLHEGQRTSFLLSRRDLEDYGNGDKRLIN